MFPGTVPATPLDRTAHTILVRGRFLELCSAQVVTGFGSWSHEYAHPYRTAGVGVVVLPWRLTDDGIMVCVRSEWVPCWSDRPVWCSVTGGVEPGESPEDAAVRELVEETGLVPVRVTALGVCHGGKASSARYHLFAVQVTGEQGPVTGDGGPAERSASHGWIPIRDVYGLSDPLLVTVTARFEQVRLLP